MVLMLFLVPGVNSNIFILKLQGSVFITMNLFTNKLTSLGTSYRTPTLPKEKNILGIPRL